MPAFTIIVEVDDPHAAGAVEAWLDRWEGRVGYLSGNRGCGCYVDIYDVEGSDKARAELPSEVLAGSDGTRSADA